jgi:hypothetical protein
MSNLFKAAKEKGATASAAPTKTEVEINDPIFHANLSRLAELNAQIDELMAETKVLTDEVKGRSIDEFRKLYEKNERYPGSFNIKSTGMVGQPEASLMFIPTDKYIKINEERFIELSSTYGPTIVNEKTTYVMDSELVEKYGEPLSNAIAKITEIPDSDKAKLIKALVSFEIAKGTIQELHKYRATVGEMLEEIKPVYQMKNVKVG